MRNGRRKPKVRRPGFLGRLIGRAERRVLGLGMRGIAAFADRQMSRYHARDAAAADEPAEG